MRQIYAEPITAEAFEPYGHVFDMTGADDTGLQLTQGPNWVDRYTQHPLVTATPSLGRTVGTDIGSPVVSMERHCNVEEVILPAADPVVLTVVAANDEAFAAASDVKSFLIAPGTAVLMHPGTWHAACAGLDGPTPYYWLASCQDAGSSPWTDIEGGPLMVTLNPTGAEGTKC